MENAQMTDPYEAVLADLRAQRERIDSTISLLEGLRSGAVPSAARPRPAEGAAPSQQHGANRPDLGPGAFLGLSIPEATKKLLASKRQQMRTVDIVAELERGGLVLTSVDKTNTVGSVLTRRFQSVGDVVRVARGIWGLQEWYPGRKFGTAKAKAEDAPKGDESEQDVTEGNEADTSPDETASPTASQNNPFAKPLDQEHDL